MNFIKKNNMDDDPNKFIHCIWYCWDSSRFEKNELELLDELTKQYSLEKLPIIIVYKTAVFKDMINKAKNFVSKYNNKFIPVLAEEIEITNGNCVKPYNLDELTKISIKEASSCVNSSCYEGIKERIKRFIKNDVYTFFLHNKCF